MGLDQALYLHVSFRKNIMKVENELFDKFGKIKKLEDFRIETIIYKLCRWVGMKWLHAFFLDLGQRNASSHDEMTGRRVKATIGNMYELMKKIRKILDAKNNLTNDVKQLVVDLMPFTSYYFSYEEYSESFFKELEQVYNELNPVITEFYENWDELWHIVDFVYYSW